VSDQKYDGFEIINIPEATPEQREKWSKYKFVESPWITFHNGITGEYFQYHRETGERREVPIDWWAV
jgi:hypothetical protein